MGTKHRYQKIISNASLGETRVITGNDRNEVQAKVAQQLTKWQEKESKQREKYHLLSMKDQALIQSKEAQERLVALKELLRRGLNEGKEFGASASKKPFPPFIFSELPPTYEQVIQRFPIPPKKPMLEVFMPSVTKTREGMEARARSEFQTALAQYEVRKAEAFGRYTQLRNAYDQGDTKVIIWVIEYIVRTLKLPEGYGNDFEVFFDALGETAVISMQLPNMIEIPRINNYKFVNVRKTIEPVELKQKDVESLYDSFLHQIVRSTIFRVFRDAYTPRLCSVVFNGWVTGIDEATGNEFTSCIISVQAEREAFQTINLELVDPRKCVRSLRGLVAGPLAQLAPVQPILELNTVDKRFVESREILASLSATDNLATMNWEDFEHLVRELFSKVFGENGGEVRVTRASRDGGVDAIAFDPDPIRGGKFVIQAKRYNNVVSVSAVRDLYGTMINEGAARGIIVTTSYYGNDSREFAKDKPITLIDGPMLLHMFQKYGYGNVRIELQN